MMYSKELAVKKLRINRTFFRAVPYNEVQIKPDVAAPQADLLKVEHSGRFEDVLVEATERVPVHDQGLGVGAQCVRDL